MAYIIKEQPKISNEFIYLHALSNALSLLKDNWFDENAGIVAATLIEGNQSISATSLYLPEEGQWLHAEAATLQQFEVQMGRAPLPSSTMVVTLSPCLLESKSRHGASCSHRLKVTGISQIRFGCLDRKQTPDISVYQELGFEAKLIGDQNL